MMPLEHFLFAVTLLVGASSAQGPRFVQEPPSSRLDFSNGTGAVLPCVAQGSPAPSVQWVTSGGASAADVPGLRHVRPDGSLVFLPFRADRYSPEVHDAPYRCAATNDAGTALSREVRVRGVVQQSYAVDVYDEFVVRGNTAVLKCRVPPQVQDYVSVTSWIRDGTLVIRPTAVAGDRFSIFDSGELHIRRVDRSDGLQQYRCETRHRLTGENVLSATAGRLLVTEAFREAPPRITSSQRLLRAPEGSTLEAPCAAQGFPPPTYEWFRRGEDGLSPLQHFGSRVLQLEGALLIRDARLHDAGHYLCRASNPKGEATADTQILVTAPLSVQVLPKSDSVDVGRPAAFNCSVSGHPVSSVEWMKDGRALRPGPGLSFPSPDRIRLTAVRRQDAGMYQCFVTSDFDSAQGTAQLTLGDYPPTLLDTFPGQQTLSPGSPLSLRCIGQGRPLPQITWSLDGAPVPDAARMGDFVRPAGQEVVSYVNVSRVGPEDGGLYACAAENGAGRARHEGRVDVLGPPFVRPMPNVTALAGDALRITCPVGGHPIDTIRWEKEGVRLPLHHRQKVFPNGTLHVTGVEKSSDSGRYTCTASNADGLTAHRSLHVAVSVRPVIDPFSFPKSLAQGQRYSVLCTVTQGDPPIRIAWTKEGGALPTDVRSVAVTPFSSSLVFESLSPGQRGNYTCSAENRAGRDSHTATMVIHVPPQWRIEPSDSSATRGKPALVDCQADGFPVPRIRWTRAEGDEFRPISSSSRLHVFENGSLVVHSAQPEDAGHYLCQASNGVGQGLSKVVHVSVHVSAHFESKFRTESVRKGEEAKLTCDAAGDRPMHLTWLKDKQAFELHSDIRYDLIETVMSGGTTSSLTIRRVDRRDSALYTCIAANAFGRDDTNIQLVVQEPPDAPQDARVQELDSRTVKIGWTPPYSGNSPIQKYVIHYKEEAGRWHRNLSAGSESSWLAVGDLHPLTHYHFRVYAENALGRSEPSNLVSARTEQEAPGGAPQKVKARGTGAHTIKVDWEPPRPDLQFGPVRGYYVGYRDSSSPREEDGGGSFVYKTLGGGQEEEEEEDVAAAAQPTTTQLSGLKRLTEYAVVVQAYNSKGAGPPSEPVIAKTLDNDPPGSPSVRVVFSNSTSIGLAWRQTDSENEVHGFVVHHKWELSDEWLETQVSSGSTEHSLYHLRCGSRYQVYVSAFNAVGRGVPSDILRAKTEGRAPVAPEKQSLVSANQSAALVRLDSWLDGGCPVHSFAVRYRQQRHPQWVSAAVAGPLVTLEDLEPDTRYRLQVTARNEAGSTDAEYSFVTAKHLPPDEDSFPLEDLLPLYLDWNIVVPAAVSFAVLVALMALVCLLVHKKGRQRDVSQTGVHSESTRKGGVRSESMPLSEKSSLKKALSYPTPYATTRISADEQKKAQAPEEPLYATVKRTPRPPRSDFHVYHYPGEMPEFFLQACHDEMGASSSSVYWKEAKLKDDFQAEQDCSQRKSQRYSQR